MSRSSAALRLCIFALISTSFISAVAWIVLGGIPGFGRMAWILGPVSAVGLLGGLLVTLETGLCEALGGVKDAPAQLQYTISRAFERLERAPPSVRIFASPLPSFAVARSPLGDPAGLVFLSQGLLSLLSERELRATLRWCALRAREKGLGLESFCAYAALKVGASSPDALKEISGLAPMECMRFLLVQPLALLLEKVGGFWPVWVPPIDFPLLQDSTGLLSEWEEHWFSAVREIRRASETWRVRA